MNSKAGILAFFAVLLEVFSLSASVIVETEYGSVEGFSQPTRSADASQPSANVFLGVPFAKPPVGQLRYEKPVEPDKWGGIREAKQFAPACVPLARIAMEFLYERQYSEDCLYLNIVAPSWKSNDTSGFAVLVNIHGGGLMMGHAVQWGFIYFAENYVTRNIIVVTIQYRVAQFGFLALDKEHLVGNYGLWDQIAALQFVQRNIARFGGDPKRVTIWGSSGGAAAVGHLTVSAKAQGLFARAIQHSGNPYADWACSERVIPSTLLFAKTLNCVDSSANGTVDPKRIKNCLKEKSVSELLDAAEQMGARRINDMNFILFNPFIDGDFHAESLSKAIARGPKIPMLMGLTDLEGILFSLTGRLKGLTDLHISPEEYDSFSETTFKKFVAKLIANDRRLALSPAKIGELRRRIFDFYIRDAEKHDFECAGANTTNSLAARDSRFFMRQQIQLVSDILFNIPNLFEAKTKAKYGWPVFFYRFSHLNEDFWMDGRLPIKATMHAGEIPYLFGQPPNIQRKFLADDWAVKDVFHDAIAGFAKTGDPTPAALAAQGKAWPRMDASPASLKHVHIQAAPSVEDSAQFLAEKFKFWTDLTKSFDLVDLHSLVDDS